MDDDDQEHDKVEAVAQVSPQPSVPPTENVHVPEFNPASSQQPHKGNTLPGLSLTNLYPAELQKVVVEHIVKHGDSTTQAATFLRL